MISNDVLMKLFPLIPQNNNVYTIMTKKKFINVHQKHVLILDCQIIINESIIGTTKTHS